MSYNYTPYQWPFTDPERFSPGKIEWTKNSPPGPDPSPYGGYNSFSGADIVAFIHIPPQELKGNDADGTIKETEPVMGVLGTLQTISYSIHREVVPVRAVSKISAHAYTRGPRTIAGTMVWATMDQYVLSEALRVTTTPDWSPGYLLADQLPMFNIIITFNNEYGHVSSMGIYDIRLVNEGSTFSVDDILTEQTNTYVAGDISMIHKGAPFKDRKTRNGLKTGNDILRKEANKRLEAHRSPFL